MNLTEALKKYLQEHCGVKADATDDEYRAAVGTAIAEQKLTPTKLTELCQEEDSKAANAFGEQLADLNKAVGGLVELLKSNGNGATATVTAPTETETSGEKTTEAGGEGGETSTGLKSVSGIVADQGGTPDSATGQKAMTVRAKEAAEQYSTKRGTLVYPDTDRSGNKHTLAGQRVTDRGHTLEDGSDQDKALAGVWAKLQLYSLPRFGGNAQRAYEMLSDHEKELLHFLVEKSEWDDSVDGRSRINKGYSNRRGHRGVKTLIDDAASGGLEAAPIVFDDQVIQAPLLHGELFPLVNRVPLDRGRRVEGVSVGKVTGGWGGVDASAISLFSTTSYVSAFDTTIFRWEGAIEIGLDFMEDTPIEFGSLITAQYGERLLEDLDDVVAAGNGTTQPEGVINKSGATTVAFGGTTSLGNYESLRFGVAKAEHGANVKSSIVFCGNETSYERATAIPVGASDARRLGGMDYDSYNWMQRPYKINESLANTQIFYAVLARYRMYLRRGFTVRQSTEGKELMLDNSMLIVVMARYGGQQERGATVAVTTTAEA